MSLAYLRYVKPFAEPVLLSREQIKEWVILSKAAMAKRTWANSMCTPEMIVDCDMKIRAFTGIETVEGRKRFIEMVSEIWTKILPAGEHALDWDGIKILGNMFHP